MKDTTKPGYVYKIILDIPKPHVVYVGSTTQTPGERLGHHATIQRRPTRLNRLIRSIGREHFSIEIIEWVDDRKERFLREHYWTVKLGNEPDNCNTCVGTQRPQALRDSASEQSYRNRAVICENDGREYRSSMIASKVYGLCCSDVSECCAMHLRQSKGYYFRYADSDRSQYIAYWESATRARNFKVRCVETGRIYDNIMEAAEAFSLRVGQVSNSCRRGSMIRKLGIHFEYVKPYAVLPSPASIDSENLS